MSLLLSQLIYTSFPGVGFKTLTSAGVPKEIQEAFVQKVIYRYWDPYNPPELGYRAAYLHQATLEHSLFGWLYNDNGSDDVGRSHIPYFVCYYSAERLHPSQLNAIFTLLDRGPTSLIDRRRPPTCLDTTVIPDVWRYQPARVGVTIPRQIRGQCYTALERGQLLDLFAPEVESDVASGAGQLLEHSPQLQLSHVGGVSFMNQPSSSQSDNHEASASNDFIRNGSNGIITSQVSAPESTSKPQDGEPSQPPQQQGWKWGLKAKVTAWAIAISMLPVLAVGATHYFGSQSITRQVTEARRAGTTDLAETELALQRQLPLLLIETGWIAVLAGVIATFMANRAIHPALNAATASTKMVKRLRREENPGTPNAGNDELAVLESNIGLLEKRLPDLLCKQEAEVERFQILMTIVRRIQSSFSEEDVLRTTVEEVRKALKTDRVVIFRFNVNGEGTFVAESVIPNWPKTLWATVSDPWFDEGDLEQYRNGRIQAIDNIYQAGLNDDYIGLLERFGVKANLVAPILKDNELFGLLIAHQCSGPRFWQQPEIDLFTQVAMQVGFALDHARLFEQIDTQVNQAQISINITRKIRESLLEEDILKTTVKEVQKVLRSDRVMVYSFDANWYGTVVAEAVFPGWPKALWAQIKDPCFVEGYVNKYQAGRVEATNDIHQAGLTECHLKQLEPFEVKANLVAPILKDDKLFGLLIAHQCSGPRVWQQPEIDLFTQIAMQVGFALDHARLLTRVEAEGIQTRFLADITRKIRGSLLEEDILKTTVKEVQKVLRSDRVMVYGFDANWYGTVVAEAVFPGWPKALWAQIKDPCFVEGYVNKYQAGRVEATNDIYQAGLTECHLKQLEPFAVKANLVAPILKDDKLFGLLIAHQCSGPRVWQQPEIDLFTQVAMQVGFALDHARLLDQVEQAYQATEAVSREQRQQKEVLQGRVSALLKEGKTAIATLSSDALNQMETVTIAYNQIQTVAGSARDMTATAQQTKLQAQQASQTVQAGHEAMSQTLVGIATIQQSFTDAANKVKRLHQASQTLSDVTSLVGNITSQLKLQAMNGVLEAARAGEAGQGFTPIAEKIQSLIRQLDADIADIKPAIGEIQMGAYEAATAIATGTEHVFKETGLVEKTQQKLKQIATVNAQVNTLAEGLAEAAANQAETSTSASQSVLEVASLASHISEQSLSVVEPFNKLATTTQELRVDIDPSNSKAH